MKAALYHRVSTLDQDPTLARGELHAHASRLGAEVVLDIEETGSGANNDRPGLQQVMHAARRGHVDTVIVWKLDRFGRSALDLQTNIAALVDSAGVRFICTSQGLDLKPGGDAISRLLLTVLAAVAEFERALIRERTRLGMARAKRQGKHIGRPSTRQSIDPAEVRKLRKLGADWDEVGEYFGVSARTARRAVADAQCKVTP